MARNRNKFNAQKTVIDGIKFASRLEADLYLLLRKWENLKLIAHLKQQSSVPLTLAKIKLIADFKFFAMGLTTIAGDLRGDVWAEAKGKELDTWRIKRKLWQFYGPGPLLVFFRSGRRGLVLDEVIIPKIPKES